MRSKRMKSFTAAVMIFAVLFSFASLPVSGAAFEYDPVTIKIPFSVAKTDIEDNAPFDVVIEPKDSSCPVPDKSEVTIYGNGSGSFEITVDEPGTYDYKIYERKGADSDIDYDDTSYTVSVFVTSNDKNELEYQMILSDGSSVKPTSVIFENKASGGTPPIGPTVTPAEPTVKPTEPTVTPAEPTVKPTEPTVTPAEPTVKPTEPTVTPAGPTDKPTPTPTKKPTDPITRTGEIISQYYPYALASIGVGAVIVVIVIIRRRREDDGN